MYIHRFLFIGVVVVCICFVGAGVILAIGIYCYLLCVVVVYVGSIVFYCVGYWEGLVGFVRVCGYCCYLCFKVWRIFICLSIVFYIYLSVLFILSGGVYLDSIAYYF